MDEFNNLIDTGRFLRVMADIETGKDEPEPHQFKRDQHLTPAALFKAKVLAVLDEELWECRNSGNGEGARTCNYLMKRVESIQP